MTRFCIECPDDEPTRATFGEIGGSPMYCKIHMKSGMIDMKNDRCNCGHGEPCFNFANEESLYCAKCKTPGMINVKSKMCIDCGKTKPSFNYPGKAPDYCAGCVKKNNFKGMVNVNNSQCPCPLGKKPSFNFKGKPAQYCGTCQEPGMINVNTKRCPDCPTGKELKASFNFPGKPALLCSGCSKKYKGMVNTAVYNKQQKLEKAKV
jgi:hypothetical protein